MGLIVPKAIFLRWPVRDLRYSQRFLSQKSSSSHKLFRLTKKITKSQNLWDLIDKFTKAIQYNTIPLTGIFHWCDFSDQQHPGPSSSSSSSGGHTMEQNQQQRLTFGKRSHVEVAEEADDDM